MDDVKTSARARLFENLRSDHVVDAEIPSAPEGKRMKPLTAAQAEAFCAMAVKSLQRRG